MNGRLTVWFLVVAAAGVSAGALRWAARDRGRAAPPPVAATPAPAAPGLDLRTDEPDEMIDRAVLELISAARNGAGTNLPETAGALGGDLGAPSVRRLVAFAAGPRPPAVPLPVWAATVNEIWNALRAQRAAPPGLSSVLCAITRETSADAVLKDYAIQHLGAWMGAELGAGEGEPDLRVRRSVFELLHENALNRSVSRAGTALYSLERAAAPGGPGEAAMPGLRELKAEFAAKLAAAAAEAASDERACAHVRISAFQVAVRTMDRRVAPAARRVARDAAQLPLVRASAIACLGKLGGAPDVGLLESVARTSRDPRLAGALGPAIGALGGTPGQGEMPEIQK
jgi:hypothetical protein